MEMTLEELALENIRKAERLEIQANQLLEMTNRILRRMKILSLVQSPKPLGEGRTEENFNHA